MQTYDERIEIIKVANKNAQDERKELDFSDEMSKINEEIFSWN